MSSTEMPLFPHKDDERSAYCSVGLVDENGQSYGVPFAVRSQTPSGKVFQVQIGPGDVISNIPVMIDYDHHQLHEGEMFHYGLYVANLAGTAVYDTVFTVPDVTVPLGVSPVVYAPHFRYDVDVNDLCNVFLYEAPTVTAATGTAKTPIAFERNGTYTTKLAILDAPTITNAGTEIDSIYFLTASTNQSKISNTGNSPHEFVLKLNTKYLFRIDSGADGCDIHVDFRWYEDLGV